MSDGERGIRATRRTVDHPDAQLVRLVMAGAPKEWLWRDPEEIGLAPGPEISEAQKSEALGEFAAASEEIERQRIEARRAALRQWWKSGRVAVVRFALVGAVQTVLRPIGRLRQSDGGTA